MRRQPEGRRRYAAVKVLPTVALGGGKAAVPLKAAALFHIGHHHQHGCALNNAFVPRNGGFLGNAVFQCLVLYRHIAGDLGVFPARCPTRQLHQLLQYLVGDLLLGELPHAPAGFDATNSIHGDNSFRYQFSVFDVSVSSAAWPEASLLLFSHSRLIFSMFSQ